MRWTSIALCSESTILLFVKIGRLRFLANTSFREDETGASWIRRESDLIENIRIIMFGHIII